METVGDILKRVRAERQITLEQASLVTHIRIHYLEALESNQFDLLPSGAQGRGFLRLYAGFLNIPLLTLQDALEGKEPEPEPVYLPPPAPLHPPETLRVPIENDAAPDQPPDPEPISDLPDLEEIIAAPPPLPAPTISIRDTYARNAPTTSPASNASTEPLTISDSQKIFIEVGETIKKQRLKLGLSIEDIERFTHIRPHYIQAMEDGQMDRLPSPVQGQGMLTNYASFIELDVDQLMLRYVEGLQVHRIEKLATQPGSKKRRVKIKNRTAQTPLRQLLSIDLIVGVVVIIGLFSLAIWGFVQITSTSNANIQPTAPSISDVLMSTSLPDIDNITQTPTPNNATPTRAPAEISGGTAIVPEAQQATQVNPPIDNTPLQLLVISNQRAWMRIIADKKIIFNGRVAPNENYNFSANEELELMTGNAAALKVTFNQTDMGILGVVGQVKDIQFTLKGAVTPTSAYTITPTPTPLMASPTVSPTGGVPTSGPTATITITPFIP